MSISSSAHGADQSGGAGLNDRAAAGTVPAEPFRMVVEEGKIREFARATRSRSAEHLRPRDPVSPVTFLACCALWMGEENSAWQGVTRDFANILHGEQEFSFHGPPPVAGTELIGLQSIDRTYEKVGARGGAMTFTEVVTRFTNPSSERTMVEMRIRSIHKHPGSAATAGNWAGPSAEPGRRDAAGRTALEPFTDAPLTITDFVRYQGASGDFNAIHHDTAFAQASGYPGPFAVGMLTGGHSGQLRHGPFRRRCRPPDPGPVEGSGVAGGRAHLPGLPAAARSGVRRHRRSGRRGSGRRSRWPVPPMAWVDLADQAGAELSGEG